ncbi:16S rRNA (adenine(1518)-N(6)/adenine(1519)-N(6))-dimethyltransferase RsmA [Alcaligenes faecalis]|jgi:16S rRNA (adenine1518-N6/adenine1519-N6)-dimethyltransferase|uniref:16S rRNA (adenine(1518)-N(6)/adenine(1519)-N(6))- dimethyltransferase RsmA n=1 Tax=Alcaligenes faecalis TaxID=511 RepID=UPI0005A6611B|nr:16S rRNA (adenine(1518)-N(6)/adenine(1519)-N(6))-dimethyltransferase RsmA [Alcaligenes faecalis]ATH98734.1 16S rRNA (adenine(1518)-N(6)/adenine(1519)-N(6))-dimethyltransferase RsmA [Alcaligenes faecalis]AYZ91520.1 16S rRNA (adenine(1518)-N(6)/adenine(1519)-N(6))-dimethyltransferase RsmA [Alcaligenes faecalis]MCX5594303.1 16S rRNA (adenine(1518)-N(6)/adenine(1519)-N(6))-dimethyltransferase RsmA [Alcaligenes faecalis]QHS35407.1 16S rRNA (adenine(1518)-N(6)/adenine(1519)-N(6))-dimethyltransfera
MAQHQARKRFGQNFLEDEAIIDQIIRAIGPRPVDNMVEIGPGLSALTRPLTQALERLRVVEIDRDLAARLRNHYSPNKLEIIEADALSVDFGALGPNLRIVGNLPYNISSPLLFHLLDYADAVVDQHFMLQREVIDRMVAKPGSSDYSRLSVMLQARYRMTKLFEVPPEAFNPPPRVVSAVVRMVPLPADRAQARDAKVFSQVVARAFAQKRKMLRGGLGDWTAHIDWEALEIAPTSRPADLSLEKYIALADHLMDKGVLQAV